nr:hypothetical protein [Pseudomonas putida]
MLRRVQVQGFQNPRLADTRQAGPGRFGQIECDPAAGQQAPAINAAGGRYQRLRGASIQPGEDPAQRCAPGAVGGLQRIVQVLQQCSALRPRQLSQCLIRQAIRTWQPPCVIKHGRIFYRLTAAQASNHAANALVEPDPLHAVEHARAGRLGMHMQASHVIAIEPMEQQDLIDLFVTQPVEGLAQATEHAMSIPPQGRLFIP